MDSDQENLVEQLTKLRKFDYMSAYIQLTALLEQVRVDARNALKQELAKDKTNGPK
jgi:hypothetical protein